MSGKARRGGLARGAAEVVKHVARRTGLLPAGTPDRLADDEKLLDRRFEQTVMVYFPDTRANLYQLRQWYAPLLALNERHSVVLVAWRTDVIQARPDFVPGVRFFSS